MGFGVALLRVLILTLHDDIPVKHKHSSVPGLHHRGQKRQVLDSPVQVVGEGGVLTSSGDEERAQVLL